MPNPLQFHSGAPRGRIGPGPLATLVLLALLLSGCQGQQDGKRPGEAPAPATGAASSVPDGRAPAAAMDGGRPSQGVTESRAVDGASIGGDGSQIELGALSSGELETLTLEGELACGFSVDGDMLLLARGDVASEEPARGVVKPGDQLETVAAPGGFDAMLRGTRFHGDGKTIDIEPTGAASGDGESPPAPATLTYHRADGARRVLAGQWQCGP